MMTDEELYRLFLMLRRPIPWDPIPVGIKINQEQATKFNEVQARLNAKIAQLDAEKVAELSKIVGFAAK
jgi:hypothetical protein